MNDRTFTMQGAREVFEMSAGAVLIERQINAIEAAIVENPTFVFDFAKSLLDTVCVTIQRDRGVHMSRKADTPDILKETLKLLKLHHEAVDPSSKTYDMIKKTANGLTTTVLGICELRNAHGPMSHGKDGYLEGLETTQAKFVAVAVDGVVNMLYRCHKSYNQIQKSERIYYQDYSEENKRLDDSYDPESLLAFVSKYPPSEVLFKVDPKAYSIAIEDIRTGEVDRGRE